MPRIFDNIEQKLLPALQETLDVSYRADFCVGYFNLRGWREIDAQIEAWAGGPNYCCRLLVGMHSRPQDQLRACLRADLSACGHAQAGTHRQAAFSFHKNNERIDNKTAVKLKKELAEEFRRQLTLGIPTNEDEAGLRHLATQIKAGKLMVKLFLRHPLHAKLYLLHRNDNITPIVGYIGSSNLTFSGLSGQGELNIDIVEQDACNKLARWFEDRWNDRWCVDISQELVDIIDESWASEKLIPPYYIYLKMAYHLSREARAGLTEFTIPRELRNKLFDFQTAAVKIAARHLNRRGGVLIGDVVGLGKTLMATALAKIFEEDYGMETLIICPKNLVKMWESYRDDYRLWAKVMSITRVINDLPELRRYRIVLIDESHNLRNRDGKRYRAIQEYIQQNESRCIMLSATPYNKSYLDLSSQLRLFVPETADLGIRPERLLREIGEIEFNRRHQCPLRSLEAFEKSEHPDDWRELMSLFMVRRTRSFIRDNYAELDPTTGRKYLSFEDGSRSYFPTRHPKTVILPETEFFHKNSVSFAHNDQYTQLYSDKVVDTINDLNLPRYGLGNYVLANPKQPPNQRESKILDDLSRGGRRLMGFCRTNLFKRLESSGHAFLLSVERHILRNYIFIHALSNNLPLPIGTQGAEMLDPRFEDEDADAVDYSTANLFDDDTEEIETKTETEFLQETQFLDKKPSFSPNKKLGFSEKPSFSSPKNSVPFIRERAANVYKLYATSLKSRFRWIRPDLFHKSLIKELRTDAEALLSILQTLGEWDVAQDAKLNALHQLLTKTHSNDKVLIFSQFADTVRYLTEQLQARGVVRLAGVTGDSPDPTGLAWRFSPVSNEKRDKISPNDELRVLISTDVLSEGQNLQDCSIVVNYDLPWAIIRLIQRTGRVDRIGQMAPDILCYTFWPADGLERLIRLRGRLRQRLRENAEVVGMDEAFFEDEADDQPLIDLYHEEAGVLDDEPETEIDLVSYAYQIWKNATDANPKLKTDIPKLPPVVYSTKETEFLPERNRVFGKNSVSGVLVYLNTAEGNSALAWIDQNGNSITESQFAILRAAECTLDTPALPRQENHHELVRKGVEHIMTESKFIGGQLGRPSGARFKTYERLSYYAQQLRGTLFETLPNSQALFKAIEQLYRFPLREGAGEKLNRQLRSDVRDEQLAELVVNLYEEDKLCLVQEEQETQEPRIICSLGLIEKTEFL